MRDVRIEPKEGAKGRTFLATCLATVEADSLWEGGLTNTDSIRPVWAMFAGSEQELRPFMANVTLGRKVLFGETRTSYRRKEDRMEFLKSSEYRVTWQKEAEGTVATIFMPDLFQLDPGMVDPKGAQFVILPPSRWASDQRIEAEPFVRHIKSLTTYTNDEETLRHWVPLAFLFCAYLDRRTRCPLVSDGRFYLQLFLACLAEGLASWSSDDRSYYHDRPFGVHRHFGFMETDTRTVSLNAGVAFKASHQEIARVLSEQVKIFFLATGGK